MMARDERQKSCSSEDQAKKTQLMELPMDILVDILLKLPAKSVACIKCVSRTLLNSVSNISFSTTHTRSHISTAAAADRRLMCCFRDDRFVTFQSLKYKDDNTLTKASRYAVTVSSSRSAPWFPHFVFRNLFCLGTKNGDCILVNALAGERGLLRLPEIRIESGPRPYKVYRASVTFGMGFDDETNTYKIVRVVQETEAETYKLKSNTAHVLVLGTNSWRQIFSHPPCHLSWRNYKPVCANGAVHWLTLSNLVQKVVSFDLRREEFCWTSTPHKYYWKMDVIGFFSLRGCLAVLETTVSRSRTEIWVLKSEQQQKRWVRYYCYNDKLPSGYEFPCDNSIGEWEHGIYFTTTHHIPYTWAVFFIDVRFGSITRVEYPIPNTYLLGLYRYSETLISLKDYGDLEEAHHQVIDG